MPLSSRSPSRSNGRAGAELPAPADLGGRALDFVAALRRADPRADSRTPPGAPKYRLELEVLLKVIRDPVFERRLGLRREFLPGPELDLVDLGIGPPSLEVTGAAIGQG